MRPKRYDIKPIKEQDIESNPDFHESMGGMPYSYRFDSAKETKENMLLQYKLIVYPFTAQVVIIQNAITLKIKHGLGYPPLVTGYAVDQEDGKAYLFSKPINPYLGIVQLLQTPQLEVTDVDAEHVYVTYAQLGDGTSTDWKLYLRIFYNGATA